MTVHHVKRSSARNWRALAILAAGSLLLASCAQDNDNDEGFPERPITIVVPFDAGGGTDLTARAMEEHASEACGTSVTISNVSGGAGAVGMQQVADAAPDGYTLAVATSSTMVSYHYGTSQITPDLFRGVMGYDADPAVLSVHPDSPYQTIEDILADLEAGENLTVATSGAGSITELAFMGMTNAAGTPPLTNVPFDGGAGAMTAAMGGQSDAVSATAGESFQHIETGQLRPLVVMADDRLDLLPDTPTLHDSGIDWSMDIWRGLVAPAETPDDAVEVLEDCFREAYETDEFQEFMVQQNFGPDFRSADEFDTFLTDIFNTYGELIEEMDISDEG